MALINARNSAHDSSVKLSPCMCSPGWRNDCNLLAHVIPSYSLDPRPFWPEGCEVKTNLAIGLISRLVSFPDVEEREEKAPGTHCSRMRVIIAKATW